MDFIDFEKTLNYCLYICDNNDSLLYELTNIQLRHITETSKKSDLKRLKEIEKMLQKEMRD